MARVRPGEWDADAEARRINTVEDVSEPMMHRMHGTEIHLTQSYFIVSYRAMVCLLALLITCASGLAFFLIRSFRSRKSRLEI